MVVNGWVVRHPTTALLQGGNMATLKCLCKCLWRSVRVLFVVLLAVYLSVALIYALWLMGSGGSPSECLFLGLCWPAMAVMLWVMAKAG